MAVPLDKLHIENLRLYGYHGVLPEETRLGQQFVLSLDLFLDASPAGLRDDLTLSVDYGAVCHFVQQVFTEQAYQTLEACGENLCRRLLLAFPRLAGVGLELKKPAAPIGTPQDYASLSLSRFWHRAFVGLGTNLGDKKENLQTALQLLKTPETQVVSVSSFYVTEPVGYADQDNFLNAVAELRTLRSPRELLALAQSIEQELHRVRTIKNGPRTIDVDILLYDDLVTDDPLLTLPHPRMTERLFVLVPLAEIAPLAVIPLAGKRVLQIKNELMKDPHYQKEVTLL